MALRVFMKLRRFCMGALGGLGRAISAGGQTAGDTDVIVKSSIFIAGTSAVPGLS